MLHTSLNFHDHFAEYLLCIFLHLSACIRPVSFLKDILISCIIYHFRPVISMHLFHHKYKLITAFLTITLTSYTYLGRIYVVGLHPRFPSYSFSKIPIASFYLCIQDKGQCISLGNMYVQYINRKKKCKTTNNARIGCNRNNARILFLRLFLGFSRLSPNWRLGLPFSFAARLD